MKTLLIALTIFLVGCKVDKKVETKSGYATKCFSSNGLSERYFLAVSTDKIVLLHSKYNSSACAPKSVLTQVSSTFKNLTYEFVKSSMRSKEANEYALCGIQEHKRNVIRNIDGINCDLSWEYIQFYFSKTSEGYKVNDLNFIPYNK